MESEIYRGRMLAQEELKLLLRSLVEERRAVEGIRGSEEWDVVFEAKGLSRGDIDLMLDDGGGKWSIHEVLRDEKGDDRVESWVSVGQNQTGAGCV